MSLREKAGRFKSRLKTEMKSVFGRDGGPSALTPSPGAATTLAAEAASSHPLLTPAQPVCEHGVNVMSSVKSEGWANLRACLDTLSQVVSVGGLGPLKTVIEGLADCTGVYEDAARGRRAYTELRSELEEIFQELQQYLTLSPTVETNISDICGLLQNEIDYVKGQQARSRTRRLTEAERDEDNIMECYKRMRSHLQGLSRKIGVSALAIVDQQAMDNRLDKLAPALSARYNSGSALKLKRGPCTEGTRVNVLGNMYQWITGQDTGNLYWLSGMAGTGKTTIGYSLCRRLDVGSNRILGASFFCSRLLPECRDVGKIIPSIAYQLAQRFQPFRYALCEVLKKTPEASDDEPSLQFEVLLLNPLLDPKVQAGLPAGVVVVIDALDECDDATSTQQIIDTLSTKSKGLPIKFVISSRPEPAIRDQMERDGSWVDARVVLHELDSREVRTDIRTYLKAELVPVSPSESDINKLVDLSGVLFIYAATVVRYVGRDSFKGNPYARLRTILDTSKQQTKAQTKDIDQLYHVILDEATSSDGLEESEREDIQLVLSTVVCAKVPLTVAALSGLLKLGDVERVNAALRPLWSVLHVVRPEMTVTTLHTSFPEYLTDPGRSGNSMWHCDLAIHHPILAQRCFECIRDASPQFNICRLESSYLNDSEVKDLDVRVERFIPIELRYACRHWAAHLYASDPPAVPALLMLLTQFLADNLLLWLEVMNLTQGLSSTPVELVTVSRWVTQHGATSDVINLLQDVCRFAATLVLSPATQSTPHIYVSMLSFLPSHSPILRYYGHRLHGMVDVQGTARDRSKGRLGGWSFRVSNCAACSPDCTLLAIAPQGSESLISLVDLSNGHLVRDMSQNKIGYISCLAFSPDGTRVASGTSGVSGGAIWVWDVRSGQTILGPLMGHAGSISCLVYSHSGSHIISGSEDCTIRIWDSNSGTLATTPLVGHNQRIVSIATSPDSTKLVAGLQDMTLRVWDVQECLVFNPIMDFTNSVVAVAISSNSNFVVAGLTDCTIHVWDIRTGQATVGIFTLTALAYLVAISPDNAYVTVGLSDGTIQIWDVNTGTAVSGQLPAHSRAATILAYSPDGTRIVSYSSHDGSLSLFDAHIVTATVDTRTLPIHLEPIYSIAISPDGKHIVSGSDRNTLRIWDRITGDLIHGPLTSHTRRVHFVRYSLDGSRILSCSCDGTLLQWNSQTGVLIEVNCRIMDSSSIPRRSQDPMFECATYSPDCSSIATISNFANFCVWDSDSGKRVLGPISGPIDNAIEPTGNLIQFSVDGMILITCYGDGTVQTWGAKTGQLISCIQHRFNLSVSAFALSPDWSHNVVAQGSINPTMNQIFIQTGKPTAGLFNGHTAHITSVQYSPDSTRVVSGSWDKTVHIWDARSGTSIFGPLFGHTSWLNCVAYSPDGTYVASASNDTTVRIWETSMQLDSSQHIGWVLRKDGWVVDGQSRRLIWVPPELHAFLILPRNTMVLSCDGYVRLNFEGALLGEAWVGCWADN